MRRRHPAERSVGLRAAAAWRRVLSTARRPQGSAVVRQLPARERRRHRRHERRVGRHQRCVRAVAGRWLEARQRLPDQSRGQRVRAVRPRFVVVRSRQRRLHDRLPITMRRERVLDAFSASTTRAHTWATSFCCARTTRRSCARTFSFESAGDDPLARRRSVSHLRRRRVSAASRPERTSSDTSRTAALELRPAATSRTIRLGRRRAIRRGGRHEGVRAAGLEAVDQRPDRIRVRPSARHRSAGTTLGSSVRGVHGPVAVWSVLSAKRPVLTAPAFISRCDDVTSQHVRRDRRRARRDGKRVGVRAHARAARHARVLGIDRFSPPHALGSSHGRTRIIREAYFEHPAYVPIVRRAFDLWRELERAVGRPLYTKTRGITIGPGGRHARARRACERRSSSRCRIACCRRPA